MLEADFEIDITRRKHIFSLDEELAERLAEIARARQIPSAVLVINGSARRWPNTLRDLV